MALRVLQGDSSIARRPMDRMAVPLRLMGAQVDGRQGGRFPPLAVRGGQPARHRVHAPGAQRPGEIGRYFLPVWGPRGRRRCTSRCPPVPTPRKCSPPPAPTSRCTQAGAGSSVVLRPSALHATTSMSPPTLPKPPSGSSLPASPRERPGAGATSTSAGAGPASSTCWCAWGRDLELVNEDPVRHTADIHVQAGPLVATDVGGAEVASLIDEIPVLSVAAAFAEGTTRFSGAAELRVKETDRVATTVELLAGARRRGRAGA